MIKSSETRDDGSYEGKSLATWHCSNVGNPYYGITPTMLSKDFPTLLECQIARNFPS